MFFRCSIAKMPFIEGQLASPTPLCRDQRYRRGRCLGFLLELINPKSGRKFSLNGLPAQRNKVPAATIR